MMSVCSIPLAPCLGGGCLNPGLNQGICDAHGTEKSAGNNRLSY